MLFFIRHNGCLVGPRVQSIVKVHIWMDSEVSVISNGVLWSMSGTSGWSLKTLKLQEVFFSLNTKSWNLNSESFLVVTEQKGGHTGQHHVGFLTDKVWFGGDSTTRQKRKTEAAKHPQSKDTKASESFCQCAVKPSNVNWEWSYSSWRNGERI